MNVYRPEDFTTFAELYDYLRHLRTAIPPVISTAEILSFQFTGTTTPITVWVYRGALVGSYLLVLAWNRASRRLVAVFVVSLICLWGTVVIHPGNPQLYDVLYPLFLLAGVELLFDAHRASTKKGALGFVAGSGLMFALAELTRPFVVLMMPLVLLGGFVVLERWRRPLLSAFLIPLILISGGWHLHLALSFGQLRATNHSGYNLVRAWPQVPRPALSAETSQPVALGRAPNINTEEHYRNSVALEHAVGRFIVEHPMSAVMHIANRLRAFVAVHTAIYDYKPTHAILNIYRPLVVVVLFVLFVNGLLLAAYALLAGTGAFRLLGHRQNLLLTLSLSSIAIMSVGDSGEEARFLISVLPLAACLPVARRLNSP